MSLPKWLSPKTWTRITGIDKLPKLAPHVIGAALRSKFPWLQSATPPDPSSRYRIIHFANAKGRGYIIADESGNDTLYKGTGPAWETTIAGLDLYAKWQHAAREITRLDSRI